MAHDSLPSEMESPPKVDEVTRLRAENERLGHRVAELERRISFQPQSGLPTHFRLEIELEELIDACRRTDDRGGFTVLIAQLGETYRSVRKSLKSSVSEWILYQTGCRISGLLRPQDRLFHTRETEFVLLLPGIKGQALAAFLKRLLPLLAEPHIFAGLNLAIGASTGAAYWPEHGEERSNLMHHADIASGFAADERRSFVLYRPALLAKVVEKVELQNSIIKAIESASLDRIGEQFFLCFQPKIHARALEGRTLVVDRIEAEALIRWRHPEKGLLGPSTFIPLAEETGLILPLGKWLLYQAARRLVSWAAGGRSGIALSVNLSPRQFRSGDAADVLAAVLARTGAPPSSLTVEITETGLFEEPEAASLALRRFADLGVRISMDDFGTGYSSLSHLHRFPLDEIKIDRQFVEDLAENKQDKIIVTSLVQIARGLDLSLIAEGVETPEALEALWGMGCRGFQGFLFAKPLLPEDFLAFYDKVVAANMRIEF